MTASGSAAEPRVSTGFTFDTGALIALERGDHRMRVVTISASHVSRHRHRVLARVVHPGADFDRVARILSAIRELVRDILLRHTAGVTDRADLYGWRALLLDPSATLLLSGERNIAQSTTARRAPSSAFHAS